VHSGETMLVSSVLSSADQSCRRASPRTRMRPTSSALRFHKVILLLLLLLLQILYKERTCMLKIRRSLKNKKKKKAAPAGRIRWQNSWIDPAIVSRMADRRGRVQRHQVRHSVLPRAGRRLQRYASSFFFFRLVPRVAKLPCDGAWSHRCRCE